MRNQTVTDRGCARHAVKRHRTVIGIGSKGGLALGALGACLFYIIIIIISKAGLVLGG